MIVRDIDDFMERIEPVDIEDVNALTKEETTFNGGKIQTSQGYEFKLSPCIRETDEYPDTVKSCNQQNISAPVETRRK